MARDPVGSERRPRAMRVPWPALAVVLLHATVAAAPDPASEIKRSLEGTRVIVRVDLPAYMDGVDIDGADGRLLDEAKYQHKLEKWGAAYLAGDTAVISKVKFGSKHIQVLLGAGGYGSWKSLGVSDAVAGMVVTQKESGIRERQRDVEQRDRDFKHSEESGTTDQREAVDIERHRLNAEKEALRREGNLEASRKRLTAEQATARRYGSRLHVRFSGPMPASVTTPAGLRQLLSSYVGFFSDTPDDRSSPADSVSTEPR